MVGRLPSDVLGTTPKYNPIVDHTWLSVDTNKYDNYPSDNNSVRVLPKLADLWNPEGVQTGVNLVPNVSCPCVTSGTKVQASEIVREAKKAMMSGLHGAEISEYLRGRFSSADLVNAREKLQELSAEQGLLGNVYIDASAFASYNEAEQFLNNHRNRLARDMVIGEGKLSADLAHVLASKFHKNILASVMYDGNIFAQYKKYLVDAGKIPREFVIDSKETLRQAFLYQPEPEEVKEAKKDAPVEQIAVQKFLSMNAEKNARMEQVAAEEMEFDRVRPIVVFAREQMSKGKSGSDLKEILRKKYVANDLKTAAKYLILVASDKAIESMSTLTASERLTEKTAEELRKIAVRFPVRKTSLEEPERERTVGVQGFFHVLSGRKQKDSDACKEAVENLRKGMTVEAVRKSLKAKMPVGEADVVLTAAVNEFNSTPAGVQANKKEETPKVKVAELPPRKTLPDKETVAAHTQSFIDFYAGADGSIPVDTSVKAASTGDAGGMFNRSGVDTFLK